MSVRALSSCRTPKTSRPTAMATTRRRNFRLDPTIQRITGGDLRAQSTSDPFHENGEASPTSDAVRPCLAVLSRSEADHGADPTPPVPDIQSLGLRHMGYFWLPVVGRPPDKP